MYSSRKYYSYCNSGIWWAGRQFCIYPSPPHWLIYLPEKWFIRGCVCFFWQWRSAKLVYAQSTMHKGSDFRTPFYPVILAKNPLSAPSSKRGLLVFVCKSIERGRQLTNLKIVLQLHCWHPLFESFSASVFFFRNKPNSSSRWFEPSSTTACFRQF